MKKVVLFFCLLMLMSFQTTSEDAISERISTLESTVLSQGSKIEALTKRIELLESTPKAESSTVIKKSEASVSVSSGRCQAITKAGTQCKRMAQAGSKYCWQHP